LPIAIMFPAGPAVQSPLMRRQLFAILSAVSLYVLLWTVCAPVRHRLFSAEDIWTWESVGGRAGTPGSVHVRFWQVLVTGSGMRGGTLHLVFYSVDANPALLSSWDNSQGSFGTPPWAEFWAHATSRTTSFVQVPLWSVALATAIMPVAWEVGHRRRWYRRLGTRRGLCGNCGYDLRASPDPQTQYHLKYSG
jgi:hypothetical protein